MTRIVYPLHVYYDGACELCRRQMKVYAWCDEHDRLFFYDISSPDFYPEKHGLEQRDLMNALHVSDDEGYVAAGVEAFTWIWWALGYKKRAMLFRIPLVSFCARVVYKMIARIRYWGNVVTGTHVCRGKCGWRGY